MVEGVEFYVCLILDETVDILSVSSRTSRFLVEKSFTSHTRCNSRCAPCVASNKGCVCWVLEHRITINYFGLK